MYCYVWSFVVRAEYLREFEAAYGPEGAWSHLFRNDPQYIRTHLLVDRDHPGRFLTIDFWSSYAAWASFRARCTSEFESLDKSFEKFTVDEVQIGTFEVFEEGGLGRVREK